MMESYLGIDSDYIILGLLAVVVIILILLVVDLAHTHGLRKQYRTFMKGESGRSLEKLLQERMDDIDDMRRKNDSNKQRLDRLENHIKQVYQKVGLVKYDAFYENGGKLSFSLALLTERDDGFVINAMHTREGCFTYIKEIVGGESIILLSEEEQQAVDMAKASEIRPARRKNKD